MITTGAICISAVLGKCSLQVLDMSFNNIGDDGITAIARTLSNSQISKLEVCECDITLTGARSLAAGLLVNNSVRILEVWGNPITVEGARLILQSAVDNGVCQEVGSDYKDDDEVKKMMIILRQRREVGEDNNVMLTSLLSWLQELQQHNTQHNTNSEDDDHLVRQDEITGRRLCCVM